MHRELLREERNRFKGKICFHRAGGDCTPMHKAHNRTRLESFDLLCIYT